MSARVPPRGPSGPAQPPDGRRRLLAAMRPGLGRGQLVAAALCALLGFAAVVQVRSTHESGLRGLRESELVGILDDVSERSQRLQAEARELERARQELRSGTSNERSALEEARRRTEVLGILAGTVPAAGPGIQLTIPDPHSEVRAEVLLDAVQELRDAGAEAIQVGPVRVVAQTYFVDDGGIVVDGQRLRPPYRLSAIGDPPTLASSLAIPGGVEERLSQDYGVTLVVEQRKQVEVLAVRALVTPEVARPAPEQSPGG
ncbi:MAG: DUF881 domain-containing protein [Actinomycetota bacterium]|nr:DUF881 domain-containing protein [Actinomycetota bacterium]